MLVVLRPLLAALAQARRDHASSADLLAAGNLRRLIWLAVVMFVIGVLHMLLFQAPAAHDPPNVQLWKHTLLRLHQGIACASALLGTLAWALHHRGHGRGLASRLCAAATFAVALGLAVLLTAVDQWVTPSITPYVIGCALTGLVILQRPLSNLVLHGLALAALLWLLGLTQADPQLLLSNRVNAVSAAMLGWLLSVMGWRTATQNLALTRLLQRRQAELEAQQRELEHLATHDGLTGLVNRAETERLCRAELLRAQRYRLPLSVLVIDLDHFKAVNDRWGHPVGDAVLVAASGVLRGTVRGSDSVGRMGGEEFMVLMPHGDAAAARTLAEKLRRALGTMTPPAGATGLVVTASVGVATALPDTVTSFERLYQQADQAMYRAKAAGRDRVELA